jgi:hypothetical protein
VVFFSLSSFFTFSLFLGCFPLAWLVSSGYMGQQNEGIWEDDGGGQQGRMTGEEGEWNGWLPGSLRSAFLMAWESERTKLNYLNNCLWHVGFTLPSSAQ